MYNFQICRKYSPDYFLILIVLFSDYNTLPFQSKSSRSRPLRSPKSSEEGKGKECTYIQDFDNESINEDSTERQLFAFLYERDWLDNRKIPVTAFTTDLGKLKNIIFCNQT